jgi:hypothetical protein
MFVEAVLRQVSTIPKKYTQAEDAFLCEMFAREGRMFWFSSLRLSLLARKGVIRRGRPARSIWRSYNGTPTYGQAKEGGE